MFWKLFVPASVLFVIKKVSRFGVPDVCGGLPCLGLSILSVVLDKKGLNIKGVICPSEIKRHLGIFTGWSTTNGLLLLPLSKLPDSTKCNEEYVRRVLCSQFHHISRGLYCTTFHFFYSVNVGENVNDVFATFFQPEVHKASALDLYIPRLYL